VGDAAAGDGDDGPAAVGGGAADAGSCGAVRCCTFHFSVTLGVGEWMGFLWGMYLGFRVPRKPFPPHTTSFFFAADAIIMWCAVVLQLKFGRKVWSVDIMRLACRVGLSRGLG
jgi:hypothetical protein